MQELSLFSCARSDCPRMRHIAQKVGYHRHDDTLPLFFTNGSDVHSSHPVPSNRGSANGAPAGGVFLVDIPEDWKPRTKQQPTGLLFATPAAWPCCSRPVPPTQKIPSHLTRDFCGGALSTALEPNTSSREMVLESSVKLKLSTTRSSKT